MTFVLTERENTKEPSLCDGCGEEGETQEIKTDLGHPDEGEPTAMLDVCEKCREQLKSIL